MVSIPTDHLDTDFDDRVGGRDIVDRIKDESDGLKVEGSLGAAFLQLGGPDGEVVDVDVLDVLFHLFFLGTV